MPKATRPKASPEAQHAKFVEAAKRLGTNDDPERFKETVKRLAKAKPASELQEKATDSTSSNKSL